MIHIIEIEPEYMAQIEAEITQSATTATDDSLANYASLRLHEEMGEFNSLTSKRGITSSQLRMNQVTITKHLLNPIHSS